MDHPRSISYLLILLALFVIVIVTYVFSDYLGLMLTSVVDFVNNNDLSKFQQCGILVPSQMNALKSELNTIVLPLLHLGIPFVMLIVALLMFLSGFYYHKGQVNDQISAEEQLKRAVAHRLVKRIHKEKK